MIHRRSFLTLAVGLAFAPVLVRAAGTGPSDVVRGFYDALLGAMKDGPALGYQGRYQRLDAAVRGAFDLAQMTRIAVGQKWAGLTEAEQQRLIENFTRYTVANYASQFRSNDGETFEVGEEAPVADGRVLTKSRMLPRQAEPIAFNYLMQQRQDGSWRIVDVLLDGTLSQLAARRSEFGSVIARSGIKGLIEILEQKVRELSAA